MNININVDEVMVSRSSPILGMRPIALNTVPKKAKSVRISSQSSGGSERFLDVDVKLKQAAEHYKISPSIQDYVIIPVPVCVTEMPNTNGDSASLKELLTFKPELGQLTYETWKFKPLFVEHDNKDIKKAVGVILDCYLRPLRKFKGNHAKMIQLLGIDRELNPRMAESYLKGENNGFSMGMWYKAYTCSICGQKVGQGIGNVCSHTRPQKPTYVAVDGRLGYRQCHNLTGFECSVVGDGAYISSVTSYVLDPRNPNKET